LTIEPFRNQRNDERHAPNRETSLRDADLRGMNQGTSVDRDHAVARIVWQFPREPLVFTQSLDDGTGYLGDFISNASAPTGSLALYGIRPIAGADLETGQAPLYQRDNGRKTGKP
jgi:hypothetical protein